MSGEFPVGGIPVMLVGVAISGLMAAVLHRLIRPRLGAVSGTALALLVWSLIAIALVTLIPAQGPPGVVAAEDRLGACSFDFGGPAPDGFWIFGGGQRLLNTLIFVPSGALWVVLAMRWVRSAWVSVPIGLVALAAYSFVIEATQLVLARLDRACDITDLVDNVTGAGIGVALGLPVALVLRPWREARPVAHDVPDH